MYAVDQKPSKAETSRRGNRKCLNAESFLHHSTAWLPTATDLHHDGLKPCLVAKHCSVFDSSSCLLSFPSCPWPFTPMHATRHLAVLLTCYDLFFLLWSSSFTCRRPFLFLGSVVISVFLTLFFYLSPSFPSFFPPFSSVSRLHVWSSWAPMDHDIAIHTNVSFSVFVACIISFYYPSVVGQSATLGCRCVSCSLAALLLSMLALLCLS